MEGFYDGHYLGTNQKLNTRQVRRQIMFLNACLTFDWSLSSGRHIVKTTVKAEFT